MHRPLPQYVEGGHHKPARKLFLACMKGLSRDAAERANHGGNGARVGTAGILPMAIGSGEDPSADIRLRTTRVRFCRRLRRVQRPRGPRDGGEATMVHRPLIARPAV